MCVYMYMCIYMSVFIYKYTMTCTYTLFKALYFTVLYTYIYIHVQTKTHIMLYNAFLKCYLCFNEEVKYCYMQIWTCSRSKHTFLQSVIFIHG